MDKSKEAHAFFFNNVPLGFGSICKAMESVEKKHFTDVAKGLAYYVLATLSRLDNPSDIGLNPEYLTELVISRLRNIQYNEVDSWLSSDLLKQAIPSVFEENAFILEQK